MAHQLPHPLTGPLPGIGPGGACDSGSRSAPVKDEPPRRCARCAAFRAAGGSNLRILTGKLRLVRLP